MKLPKITINLPPDFADRFPDDGDDITIGPRVDHRSVEEKQADSFEGAARHLIDEAARLRKIVADRRQADIERRAAPERQAKDAAE